MTASAAQMPRAVAWLGYGGLLPFIGTAAGALMADPADAGLWYLALLAYGAVIVSFVGALHWAFGMQLQATLPREATQLYVWSVVPALAGWLAMLLALVSGTGQAIAGLLLGLVLAIHLLQDHRAARWVALAPWYLRLRRRLSGVAVACLLAPLAQYLLNLG